MKTVLVTGGAGYIGSQTCKILAAAGWQPVVYDNLSGGHRWAVQWGPLEVGDIADRETLRRVIRTWQPQAAIHFAGLIAVGESVQKPALYYRENVSGSLAMLEVFCEENLRKVVFSSTCAIYGEPDVMPVNEQTPPNPMSPYGASKYMVERILADLAAAGELSYAALRYFNACGADPDGDVGEAHAPETHLIPLVLDVAMGRRASISVFGTDYETPDGTCIRDYIHTYDLAGAHLAAVEALVAAPGVLIANLGTGSGLSVRQIIDTARAVTGCDIPVVYGPRRAGDVPWLVSDVRRCRQLLPDWQPQRSDIASIIGDAWRWHHKYFRQA